MNIELINLLHNNIEIINGHWVWTGFKVNNNKYGYIFINPKRYLAHRLSVSIYHNKNYDDFSWFACHICTNTLCINPLHLYIGDKFTNKEDAIRMKTDHQTNKKFCINGHEFTPKNTYMRKDRYQRMCKECGKERKRESRNFFKKKELV